MVKQFMIKCIPLFVGLFFLLCGLFFRTASVDNMKANIAVQEDTIAELENEFDNRSSEVRQSEIKVVQSATGLDSARVEKDKEIAQKFLKPIFTWSSGKEYDAIRNQCIDMFGAESSFVTEFMPENVKSEDGTLNYIDVFHVNCHFEKLEQNVELIEGDTYTYLSLVTASNTDKKGAEGESHCVIRYSIDLDGNISNVNTFTVANVK